MSIDLYRAQRTKIHNDFGVFRYSELMNRLGVAGPSEQIVMIGLFLETRLGLEARLPHHGDSKSSLDWMGEAFTETVKKLSFEGFDLEPIDYLALRVRHLVAWNPYRELAELLNTLCGAKSYTRAFEWLRRQGFRTSLDELSTLSEIFVTWKLPRAARSFDPRKGSGKESAWLARVYYRFALKQLVSERLARTQLSALTDESRLDPDRLLEMKSRQTALSTLPDYLRRLPDGERRSIESYFGFRDHERSLGEIACDLGISEYLARTAIVSGLSRLATMLGVQGPLNEDELAVLRVLFKEGEDIESAARKLGITEAKVRRNAAGIGRKFRSSLRTRTRIQERNPSDKEIAMATENKEDDSILTRQQIIMELQHLKRTPRLRIDEAGELHASLGDIVVRVDRVLEVVSADSNLVDELHQQGVPLDWIALPDGRMDRADLPPDAQEWADTIENAYRRTRIVAEQIYYRCANEADTAPERLFGEKKEETTERIQRTLSGISQSIIRELPLQQRRSREANFRIEVDKEGKVTGFWDGDAREVRIDMHSLAADQALLVGELQEELLDIFLDVFVSDLLAGDAELPCFRRSKASTSSTLLMEWIPPTFEEQSGNG